MIHRSASVVSADRRASRRARPARWAAAALLAGALALPSLGLAQDMPDIELGDATPQDAQAVGEVLTKFGQGFATRDADLLGEVYTDDAQWLNAFGDWEVGSDAIREKFAQVFASEEFQSGENQGGRADSIRFVREDVALAWTYQEITGQREPGAPDVVLPDRHNHSLLVLTKNDEGEWLVDAQIFMDEEPSATGDDGDDAPHEGGAQD